MNGLRKTLAFFFLLLIHGVGLAQSSDELLQLVDSAYAEAKGHFSFTAKSALQELSLMILLANRYTLVPALCGHLSEGTTSSLTALFIAVSMVNKKALAS